MTAPFGIGDTLIDLSLLISRRRTQFYTVIAVGESINTIWRDSSDCHPSGGILLTPDDLAHFALPMFDLAFLDRTKHSLFQTRATTSD